MKKFRKSILYGLIFGAGVAIGTAIYSSDIYRALFVGAFTGLCVGLVDYFFGNRKSKS